MALARKHNFVVGEIIRSDEWSEELVQLYDYLIGAQAGQLLLINDFAHDVLYVENRASVNGNKVIEFKKNDVAIARINDKGQLTLLTTTVAPFDVVSTTKVVGLNADFLDGLNFTSFLAAGQKVESYLTFMFPGINVSGDKSATYIVPAGTNMQLESFEVSSSVRTGVYPDSNVDYTIVLRKGAATVSSLFCIGPTWANSSSFTQAIVENDLITVTIDTVDLHGDIEGPREICAKVKIQQDLVT